MERTQQLGQKAKATGAFGCLGNLDAFIGSINLKSYIEFGLLAAVHNYAKIPIMIIFMSGSHQLRVESHPLISCFCQSPHRGLLSPPAQTILVSRGRLHCIQRASVYNVLTVLKGFPGRIYRPWIYLA